MEYDTLNSIIKGEFTRDAYAVPLSDPIKSKKLLDIIFDRIKAKQSLIPDITHDFIIGLSLSTTSSWMAEAAMSSLEIVDGHLMFTPIDKTKLDTEGDVVSYLNYETLVTMILVQLEPEGTTWVSRSYEKNKGITFVNHVTKEGVSTTVTMDTPGYNYTGGVPTISL